MGGGARTVKVTYKQQKQSSTEVREASSYRPYSRKLRTMKAVDGGGATGPGVIVTNHYHDQGRLTSTVLT